MGNKQKGKFQESANARPMPNHVKFLVLPFVQLVSTGIPKTPYFSSLDSSCSTFPHCPKNYSLPSFSIYMHKTNTDFS
jgi:hypothetical protein